MPVKNTHSKKTKVKKLENDVEEKSEIDDAPIIPKKGKAPIDLDLPEAIGLIDDKPEEDGAIPGEESDELGIDDTGLDEDLDPFGDKWEA